MGEYLDALKSVTLDPEYRQELRSQHDFADRASENLTSRVRVNTASLVGLSIAIGAFGLRLLTESDDRLTVSIASTLCIAGILVYGTAYLYYQKESSAVNHWRGVCLEIGEELGYLAQEKFGKKLRAEKRQRKGTYLICGGVAYTVVMIVVLFLAWRKVAGDV